MGDIFSTVEVNMAAEQEVFIASLLQKIETSFQSSNWVTKLAAITRPQRMACDTLSAEYPRWREISESCDNLAIFGSKYCRCSKSKTGLYVKLYTYRSTMGDSNF